MDINARWKTLKTILIRILNMSTTNRRGKAEENNEDKNSEGKGGKEKG